MELVKTENQPGMGAIPGERETTFRVWAPNADKVCVSGTFNSWPDFEIQWKKSPMVTGLALWQTQYRVMNINLLFTRMIWF